MSSNKATTKTSSGTRSGREDTVTINSSSEDSSDDTTDRPGATPSVLELVPAESNYRQKTAAELATISDKNAEDLRALAAKIPCTYDHVPEDVWIALTTGDRGMKDKDDLVALKMCGKNVWMT